MKVIKKLLKCYICLLNMVLHKDAKDAKMEALKFKRLFNKI